LQDGLQVFIDQNRDEQEEKVPWPIWMEDKIDVADFVLLVCTELYWKKVRQKVPADVGQGVCWEANLIYNWLYERKLNTTKFIPVLLSPKQERFIPGPLKGTRRFMLNSQSDYDHLCALLTGQHRIHFPKQGEHLPTMAQRTVRPLFGSAGRDSSPAGPEAGRTAERPTPAPNLKLALKPDIPPPPRKDLRGLDWYEECDAAHFLGRDEDADRLLAMLLSPPIVRLIGPSGVGKSSLIRAGLLPRIRECGWRACVIRPFEDPGQRLPKQLTAELLLNPGSFNVPLNPTKLAEELGSLIQRAGVPRLVLLMDQFEDIVSPMAIPAAVDSMREFLGEIWQHRERKPYLRVVAVYRTDADARLGRLWQQVSGKLEGLPYLALEGLSQAATEKVIEQTAQELGWHLEIGTSEITRQLAQESQKFGCSGEVFPVYLQILLKQAQQKADGRITAEFIGGLGGVSGLIGKFLEQTLAKLKSRGGDWQHTGTVLQALSRASGIKAAQSLNDLVRETGVSRPILADMLRVLVNERLVRPVGHEIYEIQHDRLGAAVIESMKDTDRDAKTARDFLAAKVPAFERTRTPLAIGDLAYLFRHRHKIHPTEHERRIILASMSNNRTLWDEDCSPGWFWLSGAKTEEWWDRLLLIERWAGENSSPLQTQDSWLKRLPVNKLRGRVVAAASDPDWRIRIVCVESLGRARGNHRLPLLRKLAADDDPDVCCAAVEALGKFKLTKDLPLLRRAAEDQDAAVRRAAVEALGKFKLTKDLPLLRRIAKDQNASVRREAVEALGRFKNIEALPLLWELAKDKDSDVRSAAASAIRSFKDWAETLSMLRELAKDQNQDVRLAAAWTLEDFKQAKAMPMLRELAKDQNSNVRFATARALRNFKQAKSLALLRELSKDKDSDVRRAVVWTLGDLKKAKAMPMLRELAKDPHEYVREEVVRALESLKQANIPALLRKLAKDQNSGVRREAAYALRNSKKAKALPLLRELALEPNDQVAAAAAESLGVLCSHKELKDFLYQHDQQLCAGALAALDEMLYMPDWLKNKDTDKS
jgi:HEAT repeat protein